ncbi:MAG: T9SS type A sorting domain-containing protein [Lentimicrobiaceae bacterium]|jgi:photosystem II stability/assembly factor-like uncharacterized protein|nr:T9SS type A sorting domain-containing protein [Lentimicrobiaceae bacterium]
MKKHFFLLLLACTLGNANAQDFWQQLTPIPGNSTKVMCLATNSKGHIFTGVSSYPTDGVFRSIDGGQSWEQVLKTGAQGSSRPVYSITINEADHIYISGSGNNSLMRSEDDGETWENIQTPVNGWFYQILCIGLDTIYGCSGDPNGWDPAVYRTYDRGANWDVLPIYPEVTYTNEEARDIVISSDGVLYVGTLSYNNYYKGGLYRSYDQGDTWEHIAPEVDFIEHLAINSKDDIFIASAGIGFCVLRAGATTVETFPDIIYIPYDVVVDYADHVYVKSLNMYVSYDDGIAFENMENVGILRFHTGKDNFLYSYSYNHNRIYRSTLPMLSIEEQPKTKFNLNFYPNPARDNLTIYSTEIKENTTVSVYDLLGKKLFETMMRNENQVVDISMLQAGIYMLKAQTSNQTFTSKFIKY